MKEFKMKKMPGMTLLLALLLCVWCVGLAQQEKQPLTNCDVVKMIKAGSPETAIVQVIEHSAVCFDVSPQAMSALKSEGASEAVLNAIKTASRSTAGLGDSAPGSLASLPCKKGHFYWNGKEWLELVYSSNMRPVLKGIEKTFLSGGIVHGGMDMIYEGSHAQLNVNETKPTFYVHMPGKSSFIDSYFFKSRRKQVAVKLDQKQSTRLLEIKPIGIFTHGLKFKKKDVHQLVIVRVSKDVITLTPRSPLPPGEYILSELPVHGTSSLGYDFRVQ